MNNQLPGLDLTLAQIGWVVKDINAAQQFFAQSMGITGFHEPEIFRAQDYGLTYYGQAVDAEWYITQVYSGGTFIELIQPVSGQSVFRDYLDKYPNGGVQHLAYSLPVDGFDEVVSALTQKGYPVMLSMDMYIAKIRFFDTVDIVGVATEIIGITKEGEIAIEQMKSRNSVG